MKDLFFETKEFSISADRYIKSVMLKVFAHWWWMPTLLVFVSAFLAMTMSIKFLYVAIIVLFMMTSLLLVFVYVYYSSTQEARIAILQKVITINNEGIKIEFSPIKKLNYEEESNDIEEIPTEYFTPKVCPCV